MPGPGRFTSGKDPVPVVQEALRVPGPVWMGAENLAPPPGFDPRAAQRVASLILSRHFHQLVGDASGDALNTSSALRLVSTT
jgi:hypothetical protein